MYVQCKLEQFLIYPEAGYKQGLNQVMKLSCGSWWTGEEQQLCNEKCSDKSEEVEVDDVCRKDYTLTICLCGKTK